jgi:hypothetical protein
MATPLRPSSFLTAASLLSLLAACSSSTGIGDGPGSDAGTSSGDTGSSADGGGKGDSSASTDATASDGDAGHPDGSGSVDGAADALRPLTLPACLGASAPIVLSGTSAYTSVQIGATFDAGLTAAEPFLIDFGSTSSDIDLSAFNPAPATENCNDAKLGQACTFSNLSFFGSWGSVVLYTASYSSIQGSVRQAGLLATDFLSAQPIALDYKGLRVFAGASSGFCTDSELGAAGFAPMTTSGFYSDDLATLNALSTVVSGAAAGTSVPNVPTVKIQVGGVAALAQLDTGFDDSVVNHSVNINQAFLAAIQAKSPGAITRDSSLDLSLSTCIVGTSENVEAYHLAAGSTLEFVSDGGGTARSVSDAVLFVKNTPAAALVCGGIGTWTVPAAQIATSFYVDAGAMVFDPVSSRVWIPE